jgi:glycosyltransferase involved in cell wall biosynthesis
VPSAAPAVSVVMAVRNGERFLNDAVKSVCEQTFEDLELIAVDDGSEDSTAQILAAASAADRRLVVIRQQRAGRSAARNRAIKSARAPLIAILDHDDVALPDRLATQHRFLEAHPQIGLVGSRVSFIDDAGRQFYETQCALDDASIRRVFETGTPFAHSAVMFRKDVFLETSGYRPAFTAAQDLDLWMRMSERAQLANLPDVLTRYRVHPAQSSVRNLAQQAVCSLAARMAARARRRTRSDPFDKGEEISEETLLGLGATESEIDLEFCRTALWQGHIAARARYFHTASDILLEAHNRATSAGLTDLVAAIGEARRQLRFDHRRIVMYSLRKKIAKGSHAKASPYHLG